MMKDPAFMVFASDFMMETSFMSAAETGMYIKILCNIHFHGRLTEDELKYICGGEKIPFGILRNLEKDDEGKFYHKRMEHEAEKRTKYSESRQKNLKKKAENEGEQPCCEEKECAAEEKKPYGLYKNVMLTDEEYEELKERFRTGLDARIKRLSDYIKAKGAKYQSHYAVIIQWDERDKEKLEAERVSEESTFDTDDFFEAALARSRRWMSEKKKDSG